LIAGDGIHEDVGAIAELINRNAALGFALGLVEVALYKFDSGGVILQPRIVARTRIIDRTVFAVRDAKAPDIVSFDEEANGESGRTSENVAAGNNLGESARQAEYRAWWEPVLQTKFDDPDQEPANYRRQNRVQAALPWPNVWILAYRDSAKQETAVTISGGGHDFPEMMRALAPQLDDVKSELPKGSVYEKWGDGVFTFTTKRKSEEFADDDEKREWLSTTLNAYVNVLRPKLKQLVQSR
jgi:hypothetical protein